MALAILPPRPSPLTHHPAFSGPVQYLIEDRPAGADDEENTAQTIARMAQYAREDSRNQIVRRAADAATRRTRTRDLASAVHAWIRSHVSFVEDAQLAQGLTDAPDDAEVLIRPIDLLTMPNPVGDCDDFAMLAASMLRALGIEASFKTVEADPQSPGLYSHVYTVAHLPDGPLPLDCSHGPYPGWEIAPTGKARLWPVEETNTMRTRTLGDDVWDPGTIDTGPPSPSDVLALSTPVDVSSLLYSPAQLAAMTPTNPLQWPTSSPTTTAAPSNALTIATALTAAGLTDASKILGTRYAVPQLNPGQSIITSPSGAVSMSQLPTGATSFASSSANSGMILLLLAAAAVAFVMTQRKS
jgi:hypothetical protein